MVPVLGLCYVLMFQYKEKWKHKFKYYSIDNNEIADLTILPSYINIIMIVYIDFVIIILLRVRTWYI